MKRMGLIITLALVACVAVARPRGKSCTAATGAATACTNTITGVEGWVEEVQVIVTDGVSTGTVAVTVQATDSTVAAYNLATATVTDEKRWYPRIDGTATDGTALSSDPPWRFFLYGDTITMTVSSAPTGTTWRCRIKYDDGR